MATSTATKVKAVDATYYMVKDLPKQQKFYTELIGSEPAVTMEFFAEWVFPTGSAFGLYKSSENISSGSTVLFAVDDVAEAVGAAKARGVEFDQDGKIEDTPVCHMAFGKDAEGNDFILHHRKDGSAG